MAEAVGLIKNTMLKILGNNDFSHKLIDFSIN